MTNVPIERGNLDTDMHRGKIPCEGGAKIGVTLL